MTSAANIVAELEGALPPKEAARVLGVTIGTLAVWRCEGSGPAYIKDGRLVFYPRARLNEYRMGRVSLVIPEERVA